MLETIAKDPPTVLGEPVYPHEHVPLEREGGPSWLGAVELAACCALGQRAVVVGPPDSGKTTILREICHSFAVHRPDVRLDVLLIDQRAEEMGEWRAAVPSAAVHGTGSDAGPHEHVEVDEVFDTCSGLAGEGGHSLLVVDSLAALVRAFNVTLDPTDRVLTGDLMATALQAVRQRFGQARAIAGGGSLTIIAAAAVDTAAELDEVVFQELVGTGNMELRLRADIDRRELFPPIDLQRSGARHDELIVGEDTAVARARLRSWLAEQHPEAALSALFRDLQQHGSLSRVCEEFAASRALE